MTTTLQITDRSKRRQCDHIEQLSTVNFGLQRMVCLDCGSITMRKTSDADPGTLFRVPHPISGSDTDN